MEHQIYPGMLPIGAIEASKLESIALRHSSTVIAA